MDDDDGIAMVLVGLSYIGYALVLESTAFVIE